MSEQAFKDYRHLQDELFSLRADMNRLEALETYLMDKMDRAWAAMSEDERNSMENKFKEES